MSINYDLLPSHIRAGARRYIEDGVKPGGFLAAVICNDLQEAFAWADDINRECLREVVRFFYNEAPSDCWGSRNAMGEWMAMRKAKRKHGVTPADLSACNARLRATHRQAQAELTEHLGPDGEIG